MISRRLQRRRLSLALAGLLLVSAAGGSAGEQSFLPGTLRFANPSGYAETHSTVG